MIYEKIVQIVIEVVLFLIASYFLFYKTWLKSLGSQVAKFTTTDELTKLTETVKKDFNEKIEMCNNKFREELSLKIEPLKSEFGANNITHQINEKIEVCKNRLNEELSLKIEPLKSELAENNFTHQIQYGFLHQERAKAIIELYKKLIQLNAAMVDWISPIHPVIKDKEREEAERTKRANYALHDFKNYYALNKLFFSKTFCDYIDSAFKEYWDRGWDLGYRQHRLQSGLLDKESQIEYILDMNKISKELSENLPSQISDIETEFRRILNVQEA